jgi:membrane fusion protein (multidrug efflux system)
MQNSSQPHSRRRGWILSTLLIAALVGVGAGLTTWKQSQREAAAATVAQMPEPMEVVTAARAGEREHAPTTTSIGTVVALRSVTLRNELPGTVRQVALEAGRVVEPGTLLVALDVEVEEAELRALEAQAALAETLLGRMQRASENGGASQADVDRALAERDVALANVVRTRAIIERKTIRAPFRARIGLADVHQGQYLSQGTELTTLQGVDDAVYVDFPVAQAVAARLQQGDAVTVIGADPDAPLAATLVAVDARVDAATRNAWVRARLPAAVAPAPGASVRVLTPSGVAERVVTVPASALRKGPAGDHVFVIVDAEDGRARAQLRVVSAGAMLGDEIVIRAGLAAGERVATSGSFKLREGVLVMVQE